MVLNMSLIYMKLHCGKRKSIRKRSLYKDITVKFALI